MNEGKRGEAAPRQLSGRGLAYWTDGKRRPDPLRHARLPDGRARREDRRAGRSFGKNGIVDLKQDDDQEMDLDHRRGRPARRADHRRRT